MINVVDKKTLPNKTTVITYELHNEDKNKVAHDLMSNFIHYALENETTITPNNIYEQPSKLVQLVTIQQSNNHTLRNIINDLKLGKTYDKTKTDTI